MRSIFISYRRNDSEGEAGRLFDALVSQFGEGSVFMDVAAIEPGRDFRKVIDQSVATCSVLLAIVGQNWLDSKDSSGGRRLDDANDFVRIELASALLRDTPVVPVLVHGASMPREDQLPDDLKELAYRNAVVLSHARWKSDIDVLVQALRGYLPEKPAPAQSPAMTGKHRDAGLLEAKSAQGTTTKPTTFQAQTIERVTRDLGSFIGPISGIVVKRAAQKCSSLEELWRQVSKEIVRETDREKFVRLCQRNQAATDGPLGS